MYKKQNKHTINKTNTPQHVHTGQEEIEATCFSLSERLDHMRSGGQEVPELMILPIYSQLPSDLQVCMCVRFCFVCARCFRFSLKCVCVYIVCDRRLARREQPKQTCIFFLAPSLPVWRVHHLHHTPAHCSHTHCTYATHFPLLRLHTHTGQDL